MWDIITYEITQRNGKKGESLYLDLPNAALVHCTQMNTCSTWFDKKITLLWKVIFPASWFFIFPSSKCSKYYFCKARCCRLACKLAPPGPMPFLIFKPHVDGAVEIKSGCHRGYITRPAPLTEHCRFNWNQGYRYWVASMEQRTIQLLETLCQSNPIERQYWQSRHQYRQFFPRSKEAKVWMKTPWLTTLIFSDGYSINEFNAASDAYGAGLYLTGSSIWLILNRKLLTVHLKRTRPVGLAVAYLSAILILRILFKWKTW